MENKIYWIWLALKETIPMRDRLTLLKVFGDVRKLYETVEYDVSLKLPPEVENELMDKSLKEAESVYNRVLGIGGYVITLDDEEYPKLLASISVPPLVLYCKGKHMDWENTFRITFVGTREYSDYGRKATEKIVMELAEYGTVIVSGMARGIDAIAGCAALHAGGDTVAVLGSGLDVIYPSEHRSMYRYITKHGVIITEHPPGTRPLKHNFPRRNRIMAGLSPGLAVGQAPIKSGALISAAYAIEMGRSVYAVPSHIYDEEFAGCNELIKQGAKLLSCADDIIEDFDYLKLQKRHARQKPQKRHVDTTGLNENEVKIVNMLCDGRMHIDDIARRMAMSSSEINTVMMMLEINGAAKKYSGNIYGIKE